MLKINTPKILTPENLRFWIFFRPKRPLSLTFPTLFMSYSCTGHIYSKIVISSLLQKRSCHYCCAQTRVFCSNEPSALAKFCLRRRWGMDGALVARGGGRVVARGEVEQLARGEVWLVAEQPGAVPSTAHQELPSAPCSANGSAAPVVSAEQQGSSRQ